MNRKNNYLKRDKGLTLVEVLVAASIILTFLLALFTVHNYYLKIAFSNKNFIKGGELAEEGLEITRFLRDSSWETNIASRTLNTDYYLNFEGGLWQATVTPSVIDGIYYRVIRFSAVSRDISSNIVTSGGTIDPNTLLAVSIVSWFNGSATSTKSISTYITNIFEN